MRMTQDAIVAQTTAMTNCYARIVTALRDLDVLMGEAERKCQDPKALEKMRDVYRQAHSIPRPWSVDGEDLLGDTKSP